MNGVQKYTTFSHQYEIDLGKPIDPNIPPEPFVLHQLSTDQKFEYQAWWGSIADRIRFIERRSYLIDRLIYTGLDERCLFEHIIPDLSRSYLEKSLRGAVFYTTPMPYRNAAHVNVDSDDAVFYHFGGIDDYPLEFDGKRFIGTEEDWIIAISDWNLDPVVQYIDFGRLQQDIRYINKRNIDVYDGSGNPL